MTSPGYTALTGAIALLEEPRVIFEVRGDRAHRVVNGLVTNSLDGIDDGVGCYAFALTARGRPIADLRVLPAPGFEAARAREPGTDPGRPQSLWIDAPAAAAEGLRDLFTRTVPPIFATVDELDLRRISLVGPEAGPTALLEAAGIAFDHARARRAGPLLALTVRCEADSGVADGLLVAREPIESGGWDLYVPTRDAERIRPRLESGLRGVGGSPATAADWQIVRVERGLPAFGAEITGENLPQETGQTNRAISFEKGCYTGQEVVARIHYRGHVNRLLRGLRPIGDAPDPLRAGERLEREGRELGRVATAVESPRLGSIGLGYIRREVEPGELLTREGGAGEAEVVDLPFTIR
jgi:folate-binding protein YgfZ